MKGKGRPPLSYAMSTDFSPPSSNCLIAASSCSNVNCLVLTTPDSDPIAGSRRRKAAALRNNHVCFGPNGPTELTELRPDRTGRFSGRNSWLGPAIFSSGPGPIGPVQRGPRAGRKARSVRPGLAEIAEWRAAGIGVGDLQRFVRS